ncbi:MULTISPECIES: AAA family ATPase [unclassified Cedecea]|uniref:AAA family ATPase n=1 Tax=unclassified Cedecea TaxID=2649846 RepID=UPI003018668A
MLIIMNGLPGSGKSTVAKMLCEKLSAVYLRVDTVEQAILSAFETERKPGPEGYFVIYALARENLKLGSTVVTDSVNDINLVRDAFRDIAISLEIPFIEIEIICSDKEQHRHRVENRVSDIPGLTVPDWEKVQSRHYERWYREHIQLDTAKLTVTECVNRILALTEQDRIGNNLTIHR